MKTLYSIVIITAVLLALVLRQCYIDGVLGAAKVLLRTNPLIGLSVILGCAAILAICWYFYPKINKP